MKRRIVAILLTLVMVASVFGAVSIVKTSAAGETLTLASSNYNPTAGQQYTLTATLRDSAGNGLGGKTVQLFYHFEGQNWAGPEPLPYSGTDGQYGKTTSSTQTVYLQAGYYVNNAWVSSNVVTINVKQPVKTPTQTTIKSSTTCPAPNEQVTITVTLKAGSTGLPRPVKLWYTKNGGPRVDKGTVNTASNGVYTFSGPLGSVGTYVYHADFAGDGQYGASSGSVTINVVNKAASAIRIDGPYYEPKVGETAPFVVYLTSGGGNPLDGKAVNIWYTTPTGETHTVSNTGTDYMGSIQFSSTFPSAGTYTYYATYAGDCSIQKAQAQLKVNVVTKDSTRLGMALTFHGGTVTLTGWLEDANYHPLPGVHTVWITSPIEGSKWVIVTDGHFNAGDWIRLPVDQSFEGRFYSDDSYGASWNYI